MIVIDGTPPGGPALPPAPWTNVLANPGFGCLVTEAGLGYTWAGNSQMNRLTPWSNDPGSDPPGEVIYLRDEETGEVWTPTPLPCGPRAAITVRHGQGFTRYTHVSRGLDQDVLVLVPPDDPVKLVCLTVAKQRRPAAPPVGDVLCRMGARHRSRERPAASGLRARPGMRCRPGPERLGRQLRRADRLPGRRPVGARSVTADRTEFLGRNGSVSAPAALGRVGLSGRVGPALDPAAAVMTDIVLAPGEATELVFVLGQAESPEQVRRLVAAYTAAGRAGEVLAEVQQRWDHLLNAVQVKTPDPGMDLMLNRWLLYQVLACRVWARSAFYQSGGAYGFRDQLQDVMALAYSAPEEARAQILRSAARQFEEGDVQHWWHPPTGRRRPHPDHRRSLFPAPGRPPLRHRDRRHRVARRGRAVPQVAGAPRRTRRKTSTVPELSEQSGTVYEHCVRALEHGYRLGPHGLPLMGTGDWNDGMNKVGAEGKGESVWNGWFFVTVLNSFATLAERRGQAARCELVPGAGRGAAGGARGERLGRRLVPPGVLRRRHAPGIRPERRMPDRRDPSGLGGDLRRRGPGAGPIGDGRGPRSAWCAATTS